MSNEEAIVSGKVECYVSLQVTPGRERRDERGGGVVRGEGVATGR